MSQHSIVSGNSKIGWARRDDPISRRITDRRESSAQLATSITREASAQTYQTIRFLADRERTSDAYRAYGYFRWVDDQLDGSKLDYAGRIAFVQRQQALIQYAYRGEHPQSLTHEEQILFDLIEGNPAQNSGLQAYIRHLMDVMAFDAERRGRSISERELRDYSLDLATAVTEALHYFIGHDDFSPQGEFRYYAVIGAHITHMLRDTLEDVAAGYFNISEEFLRLHEIQAYDVTSEAYREWVKSRVELARAYFQDGKFYLALVSNRRCRIAGYSYMARFEAVLDAIEAADYRLQSSYPERNRWTTALQMGWSVVLHWFG